MIGSRGTSWPFLAVVVLAACSPEPWGRGDVTDEPVPDAVVSARVESGRSTDATLRSRVDAGIADAGKQVLFGDLHVHTTFSPDAFIISMPLTGGEGAHPPADACDFARYCSGLDFWSINDHAEGITPRRWKETRESIRQCNAVAGNPESPDMVTLLGWEWSQVDLDRNKHYGHKNVIFRETADDKVPSRSIAAPREQLAVAPMGRPVQLLMALADWENRDNYLQIQTYYGEVADTPMCPKGVDTRELPDDCHETAADPATLFEKLDQWGFESIVIPHGNAWGLNTPPGLTFDKQLVGKHHDPDRQILYEVYSGHGNAEEYRDWRAVEFAKDGSRICPEATDGYEPCCRRAGEIIRDRCEGVSSADCDQRVAEAQQNYVDASVTGYWTVPGTTVEDWKGCGQCTDCFAPPFDLRPAATAQYALAISNFDEAKPRRFRFGLIGSSDNHFGRGGTGYKEFSRHGMTEATGPVSGAAGNPFADDREPLPESTAYDHSVVKLGLPKLRHMERQASFYVTGGLVAAHSVGRDRDALWESLGRREVYATSGDRILLWFDLLARDGTSHPMGSEVRSGEIPRFRVRAAGSFEQLPGCPDHSVAALGDEGIERLCHGECFNPGAKRRVITRIEVVRILPQIHPGEDVGSLVEDPWKSIECPLDPAGCVVEFDDETFLSGGREALYYVRAIQEATPAVNAANERCRYDEAGNCVEMNPCYGDYRTAFDDDCLAENEERAWSSPIFVTPAGA